jgi:hypothetical protein
VWLTRLTFSRGLYRTRRSPRQLRPPPGMQAEWTQRSRYAQSKDIAIGDGEQLALNNLRTMGELCFRYQPGRQHLTISLWPGGCICQTLASRLADSPQDNVANGSQNASQNGHGFNKPDKTS